MSKKGYKRSLRFAFIGSGEGGGRLAATFGRMGYPAAAINITEADLARLWDVLLVLQGAQLIQNGRGRVFRLSRTGRRLERLCSHRYN